eukprot:m.407161 g.407161  ORF g.407161 m.407161 type:complete len:79 (-) comp16797_c0_seq5:2060-2296(-)
MHQVSVVIQNKPEAVKTNELAKRFRCLANFKLRHNLNCDGWPLTLREFERGRCCLSSSGSLFPRQRDRFLPHRATSSN